MSLKTNIESEIKKAMLAKAKDRLTALRGIKSMILLAETDKANPEGLTSEVEAQLLMKAAKQRRESAAIYAEKGRNDLADKETLELAVIEEFLPKQLSESEVSDKIKAIIAQLGATSAADMGKVMGAATKELAGLTDNKLVASKVKELLTA